MHAVAFLSTGEEHPASVMSGCDLMRSYFGSQDGQSNGSVWLHLFSQNAEERSDLVCSVYNREIHANYLTYV